MACFHPKKGWIVGVTENGKPKYKITDWSVDHIEFTGEGDSPFVCSSVSDLSSRAVYAIRQFTLIPCGKCAGCRMDYARQWSARIQCEYQMYDPSECWFITLTYDDEHLPVRIGANSLDEMTVFPSLNQEDMQLFLKRLRRKVEPKKIRYFYAGEYGTIGKRPHYHMIVFGLDFPEKSLLPYKLTPSGDQLYKSPWLDSIWTKGFCTIGSVTLESAAYTARYCMKKIYDDGDDYSNREPEFIRMSRRPGIGKEWLDAHPEVFEVSQFSLPSKKGCQTFSHPRYFLKYLDKFDPVRYNELKVERQRAGSLSYLNAQLDGRDYLDVLRSQELDFLSKISKFKRNL